MKYLKYYTINESIYDRVKKYLNKYVIIKPNNSNDYYLIQVKEEMINDYIVTKKLFTLRKDEYIKKCKNQKYNITIERLEKDNIYYSDNLIDTYGILNSIYDAKKYNL